MPGSSPAVFFLTFWMAPGQKYQENQTQIGRAISSGAFPAWHVNVDENPEEKALIRNPHVLLKPSMLLLLLVLLRKEEKHECGLGCCDIWVAIWPALPHGSKAGDGWWPSLCTGATGRYLGPSVPLP